MRDIFRIFPIEMIRLIFIFTEQQMTVAKIVIVVAVLISLANCFQVYDDYQNFLRYALEYGKKYDNPALKLYRFAMYRMNLQDIAFLNANDEASGVYGETQFTDWSRSEMKTMLGMKVPHNHKSTNLTTYTEKKDKNSAAPDVWNWVQQGAVTEIKDQGTCGSCWTFSTAGNIEGAYFMKYKELMNFSEQQLIDCDKSNFGCNGGWPYMALDWLSHHNGLMKLEDYPLRVNYSGPCQFDESKAKAKVKGYQNITRNETILKDALYELGPLSIGLDFTGLFHYKSGVASPTFCTTWPDHALVLVGYGVKEEDYWLIKNSWGPKWGLSGYLMLKRGKNKCGVSYWATTAVLE